jgi:CPA2 family monovalent cation:H+ antiporter-2
VLVTGLPILAVTQPMIGGLYGPLVFALLLIGLGISFWRGAADLQGHVQAGAQTIVEALIAQARTRSAAGPALTAPVDTLEQVRALLPGIGEPTPVQLQDGSPAVGKSLTELNLRGLTGATVLAIGRGEEGLLVPTPREILRAGDVLALAGSHDAIDAATELLTNATGVAGGATRPADA